MLAFRDVNVPAYGGGSLGSRKALDPRPGAAA
jgi:hypothetical protein